jgi:putative transposase
LDEVTNRWSWPHAPVHKLGQSGTFIVTAGTFHKEHFFSEPERLDYLQDLILRTMQEYGWQLEAWAIFSNHYHLIGHSPEQQASSESLRVIIRRMHSEAARWVNSKDSTPGRTVWHNYWESQLTFEKSYLARLNYVHHNAVRHGLVTVAKNYKWCSADWFERTARPAQVKTIYSFPIDKLNIVDDY